MRHFGEPVDKEWHIELCLNAAIRLGSESCASVDAQGAALSSHVSWRKFPCIPSHWTGAGTMWRREPYSLCLSDSVQG